MVATRQIYAAVGPEEFTRLFAPETRARLESIGQVTYATTARASLPSGAAETYDAIVTSWSTDPFDADAVLGERLQLAVHAAGTVRGLFPKSAIEAGLRVTQGGAFALAQGVADMAIALSYATLRNLHLHDRAMQGDRDWSATRGMLGQSIAAQRVGIIGLSRVGQAFARNLRGVGVTRIAAYDPFAAERDAADLGVRLVGLDELFASSDLVSIHAPLTPTTEGLIGEKQLAALPDGGVLINTARALIVEQSALLREVKSGRIRAALDVFEEEPLLSNSPFLGLSNVIVTPHVAGGTVQAREMQGEVVVDELERFFGDGELRHEVTPENYDRLA